MAPPHKPTGYSTVSPYLIVEGADSTIGFLEQIFGATPLRRIASESGKVMHAEVRIADTVVMLADAVPPAWPAVPAHVHVYVGDVDAVYRKALEAGAAAVQAPVQRGDENRRGAVRDAGGTTWWISTKVE